MYRRRMPGGTIPRSLPASVRKAKCCQPIFFQSNPRMPKVWVPESCWWRAKPRRSAIRQNGDSVGSLPCPRRTRTHSTGARMSRFRVCLRVRRRRKTVPTRSISEDHSKCLRCSRCSSRPAKLEGAEHVFDGVYRYRRETSLRTNPCGST
jgi:hypothetical protein